MASDSFKVKKSINIEPKSGTSAAAEGDISYNSTSHKIETHNGTTASPIVTEAHAATLTNKTIDSDNNTISNIVDANIKSTAAISRSKIATGTTSSFVYNDSSTGALTSKTATEATALLNNMVGDGGSGGTNGLVPAPAAGDAAAGKFLKADGTWAASSGGTVTSVAMTVPTGFSVAGSPVTTTGTLAVSLSTQAANTVFSGPSSGADATPTFRALVNADIPAAAQVVSIRDEKANNTAGGSFSSGAWRTRVLNTLDNPLSFSWVSLSSNQITLTAGTYEVYARAPAFRVAYHVARLYNISDSTVTAYGSSGYSNEGATYCMDASVIETTFTIAGTKTFEVQHRTGTAEGTAGSGFGTISSGNIGDSNALSVFTTVRIIKLK